jgi:arylsulfatase A-like enzyme
MPPPNIVLIMTDQQRLDTIAARHSAFPCKTPNIDKLYRHGCFFENAYCTAPICGPSRSTIMTGLFPSQAGIYGNLGNPCSPLNERITTIGHRMQALGYETVYHGKWHLGGDISRYGFEVAIDNGHDASIVTDAGRFWRNRDWMVYKRPFFQVVSFLNPHDIYFFDTEEEADPTAPPWANARDDLSRKPWPQRRAQMKDWSPRRWEAYRRFYGSRMELVDRQIGETVDELIYSGFGPNTWIILTTDHGDMGGEHGIPFKGAYMYEGVTHVPLLIIPPQKRFTGKGHPGLGTPSYQPRTSSALVSLIDLVPTILELAGAEPDPTLPGKSLLPAVEDEEFAGHDAVFAEWHQAGKLVTPIRMVRSGKWKYNFYLHNGAELYDLEKDPHEMNNLAGRTEFSAIEKEMKARIDAHVQRTGDNFYKYQTTDAEGSPYSLLLDPGAIA